MPKPIEVTVVVKSKLAESVSWAIDVLRVTEGLSLEEKLKAAWEILLKETSP